MVEELPLHVLHYCLEEVSRVHVVHHLLQLLQAHRPHRRTPILRPCPALLLLRQQHRLPPLQYLSTHPMRAVKLVEEVSVHLLHHLLHLLQAHQEVSVPLLKKLLKH